MCLCQDSFECTLTHKIAGSNTEKTFKHCDAVPTESPTPSPTNIPTPSPTTPALQVGTTVVLENKQFNTFLGAANNNDPIRRLSSSRLGYENGDDLKFFDVIDAGDGLIQLYNRQHKTYLRINGDGEANCGSSNGDWTKFEAVTHSDGQVSLTSATFGSYIGTDSTKIYPSTVTYAAPWVLYTATEVAYPYVFQAGTKSRLSSSESLGLVRSTAGTYTIRQAHKKLACNAVGGRVCTHSEMIQSWQLFNAQWCACSMVMDSTISFYPMQKAPSPGVNFMCGGDAAGIRSCGEKDPSDVCCVF